jgi:Asp-tRNA(Asn)/Glu-tRNA(Gln) amidotransferase A subunit family amidase
MQLLGRHFDESLLLQVGRAVEEATAEAEGAVSQTR